MCGQVDIRDVVLTGVGLEAGRPVLGVGKHVCGVATDLSLRALGRYTQGQGRVQAVALATCCYHVCQWRDYVGKDTWTHELVRHRSEAAGGKPVIV